MSESIPAKLVQDWITELQSNLKHASEEAKDRTESLRYQAMREGVQQIQSRLKTWLLHQQNREALSRSGKIFLITKDIDLSDGRYKKLEWYQDDLFVVLAWRHARDAETGELMLELQHVEDLSKTFLVYEGGSSYDEMAALAREGGLDSVKNEGNRQEWVEKVWR